MWHKDGDTLVNTKERLKIEFTGGEDGLPLYALFKTDADGNHIDLLVQSNDMKEIILELP